MGYTYGQILAHHKWLPFKNTSGEEIPAWVPIDITGSEDFDGTPGFTAQKPGLNWRPFWPVNGPQKVKAGGTGYLTLDIGKPIMLNVPEGEIDTPNITAGVTANSFHVDPRLDGFKITGLRINNLMLAWQYVINIFPVDDQGEVHALETEITGYNEEVDPPEAIWSNVSTGMKVNLNATWAADGKPLGADTNHLAVCSFKGAAGGGMIDAWWIGGEAKG